MGETRGCKRVETGDKKRKGGAIKQHPLTKVKLERELRFAYGMLKGINMYDTLDDQGYTHICTHR